MRHFLPAMLSVVATRFRPAFVLFGICGMSILACLSAMAQGYGGPPAHNNWKLQVSFSGTAQSTLSDLTYCPYWGSAVQVPPSYTMAVSSNGTSLASLGNQFSPTYSGGMTVSFRAFADRAQSFFYGTTQQQLGSGTVTITLTWQPKNNDFQANPPPHQMKICYRRFASVGYSLVTQGPLGQYAHGNIDAAFGGLPVTASGSLTLAPDFLPGGDADCDQDFVVQTLQVNPMSGTATKQFSFQWNLSSVAFANWGGGQVGAHTEADLGVDFCVAGFDLGRFGSNHRSRSGGHGAGSTDPTYTRWLPLAFSPQVSSQPFRFQAGALPAPWGNLNCLYSMTVRQEPTSPNLDLDGQTQLFRPSAGSNGSFSSAGPPYAPLLPTFLPQYALTDANGDRLVWDALWNPNSDVHSTLASSPGILQLVNAGPPGALRDKGHYTYTFQVITQTPLYARLISIEDNLNASQAPAVNKQTLTWNDVGDPFLTVTDLSTGGMGVTGRQLIFHKGSNNYLSAVDAPTENGTGVFTHTTTSFDTGGHLTAVNVYAGGSNTVLHSDTFSYGGPNGDAVVMTQQGVSTTSFSWLADTLRPDPFGNAVPRLSSITYGNAGDTSSSDDGGSVAGTFSFTWGPTQQGYNNWGIETRTNLITDALGHVYTDIFSLTEEVSGAINGDTYIGPDFTGAPAHSNIVNVSYTPDIANPTTVVLTDPTIVPNVTFPWQWDFNAQIGKLVSFHDPLGATWQWAWSQDGQYLNTITDPTSISLTFHYNENNNPPHRLTSVVDNAGVTRLLLDYNVYGQPRAFTIPANVSASGQAEQLLLSYDPIRGDLLSATNPLGDKLTVTGYDALGDPLGVTFYPDTGNPATSTAPLTTTITYDAAQMPTRITGPDGTRLDVTSTNGVVSRYQINNPAVNPNAPLAQLDLQRDSRGRVYAASDLLGSLAQYRYDKNSNLTQLWDGAGHITRFTYGANGEPTGTTWPDGINHTSLSYDAAGRLAQAIDERGNVSTYGYDGASRFTDIQFPQTPGVNVHTIYDSAGRLLSITDSSGSRTFAYDPFLKRLSSVTTVLSGLPAGHNTFVNSYLYYSDGSLASITTPVGTTQYHYDVGGRLIRLDDPFGNSTQWQYDHIGRLLNETTTTTANAHLSTSYTWGLQSPSQFLTNVDESVNGQALWSYSLIHSALGQILALNESGTQAGQSGSASYSYDLRGRLTSEQAILHPNANTTYTSPNVYAYDAAGNLVGSPDGQGHPRWNANASNQITSAPSLPEAPALSGANGLSYDPAGNLTSLNGISLTWDVWGQLASAGGATYAYDGAGRRIKKTIGGVSTFYLYDGDALIAELDSQGNLVRSYAWGALGLISDRIPSINGPLTRFYRFDPLGNTRFLLDANGTILEQAAYTSMGSTLSPSYPSTPFSWKGRFGIYRDSESGLFLTEARYYTPALGRFLSRDPSGFGAGPNLYAYCMGDPIDFVDPNGCNGILIEKLFGFDWANPLNSVPGYLPLKEGMREGEDMFRNLVGSSQRAGSVRGLYEGNKASAEDLADAYIDYGFNLAMAATAIAGVGQTALEARELSAAAKTCRASRGPKCFLAGTQVWMQTTDKKGKLHTYPKPIEQIKAGETVLTRNEQTGQTQVQKVERTTVRHTDVVLTVGLANTKTGKLVEIITTTREHPFFVEGKGFVPAGGLAIGNVIITRAGPTLVIKSIQWKRHNEGYKVYNLVIARDHTYFVGKTNGGAWVHNPDQLCLDLDLGPDPPRPTEAYDREKHYGTTPTPAQTASVPPGMSFDHQPTLVEHYYEGDGAGGKPGFQMTQAEREAHAKSLSSGRPATTAEQDAQGGWAAGYSKRMKKKFGL